MVSLQVLKKQDIWDISADFYIYLWVTAKRSPLALWGRYFWLMFWKSAGGWEKGKKANLLLLRKHMQADKKVYRKSSNAAQEGLRII